jgi:hypothetical protein
VADGARYANPLEPPSQGAEEIANAIAAALHFAAAAPPATLVFAG